MQVGIARSFLKTMKCWFEQYRGWERWWPSTKTKRCEYGGGL